ncbi:MAG TPA: hypothetical protein VLS96_22140 [Nodosilinea sp.]|nr:hypothetical protein [Nodosilinea sp.]
MTTKLVAIALSALAGAGIATLALTATPLRAQTQTGWGMGRQMMGERWQGGPGMGQGMGQGMGPGMGQEMTGMPCQGGAVDPANLETLQGTATEIDRGGHQGVFLTLTTAQETLTVHLGPAWYLDDQGFELDLTSPLEVTGFRHAWYGQSALMATQVKQGDRVLPLRDVEGYPLWMEQRGDAR